MVILGKREETGANNENTQTGRRMVLEEIHTILKNIQGAFLPWTTNCKM